MGRHHPSVVAVVLSVLIASIVVLPATGAASQPGGVIELKLAETYLGPQVVVSGAARGAVGIPDLVVVIERADLAGPAIFDGAPTTALLPPPGDPGVSWRVPLQLADGSYRAEVTASVDGQVIDRVSGEFVVTSDVEPPLELVAPDATWSYFDHGSEPAPSGDVVPIEWYEPGYDTGAWAQGPAELGYGDGDEATLTAATADLGRPIQTQYFRHEFTPPDLAEYDSLTLTMLRDDGAIVYLNGVELGRTNMPAGPVDYGTFALMSSEQTIRASLDTTDLVPGGNVLAVEVHQSSLTSTDLSFSLSLRANPAAAAKVSNSTEGTFLLAAGDMAQCDFDGDEAIAAQMDELFDTDSGVFLGLGDLVYENGTIDEFVSCYDPTIGRFRDVTWPAPGNHEHHTAPNAAGYRQYFGPAAGPAAGPNGGLWYSFDIDEYWHVIALDSDCAGREILPGALDGDGCAVGSEQERWLRADLEANKDKNILAFFHHPPFTNNRYLDHEYTFPLWRALREYGAELTLHGHEHHYERYVPLDYWGDADPQGTAEFIIGSGGANPRYDQRPPEAESAFRGTFPAGTNDFGVLQLWLRPDGYEWLWQSIYGLAPTDSGTAGLTPPMQLGRVSGEVLPQFTDDRFAGFDVCAVADRTQVETCALTDDDGRFVIDGLVDDGYLVSVIDPDGRWVMQSLPQPLDFASSFDEVVLLEMYRTWDVSGTITSAKDGLPIANATVCAQRVDQAPPLGPQAPSCTNSAPDGTYTIERLAPQSEHRLWFESTGYVSECFDDQPAPCDDAGTAVRAVFEDVAGIDAALEVAPGGITGTVTGTDTGAPLAAAVVCADSPRLDEPACEVTAVDGTYAIGGLPSANYVVTFEDLGGTYEFQCYRARPCTRPLLVGVIQPGVRTGINATLALAPPSTATPTPDGTVAPTPTATSMPTPMPTPTLTPAPTLTPSPTAAATSVPTPTPTQPPTATPVPTPTPTPTPTQPPTATPVPTASPTPTPTVQVRVGAIQGRVSLLETGEPIFAARVCAVRGLPAGEFCVFSGLDGRYLIDGLGPGNYSIAATDPAGRYLPNCAGSSPCDQPFMYGVTSTQGVTGADVSLDPVFTTSNPTPTPTPFISAAGVISGRVTSGGVVAEGVEVCAVATFTSTITCTTTDGQGRYEIGRLRTGNYRIEFDGAALCFRQRVGCVSFTPVGLASPGSRTGIDADLGG